MMMKRLLKWLALLMLIAVIGAALLALQTAPLLPRPAALSASDIQRAKDFLRHNDPRQLPPGPLRQVQLGEADLNLLLGHLALRSPLLLAADVRLQPGIAWLRASVALGATSLWLNVDAKLQQAARLPNVERLRIGRLPVPAFIANWALRRARLQFQDEAEAQLASELIEHIGFGAQQLQMSYRWQADSLDRMLTNLWPAAEQQRIRLYQARLAELAASHQPGGAVSLSELLPPMFALARERSAAQGLAVAAAENRAAVLTLALHANHRSWAQMMPAARSWPAIRPLTVTLFGREDFPLHFLISAVLAIEGGGPLADAIGVDKELADARSGSGFSFNDIAADRAGSRFGLLATEAPLRLQAAMVAGLKERDFMPEVADLPEFMHEQDFAQRYGGVSAPAYLAMMKDIEARLDAMPLFKLP
ncbi:hypothetical protein BH11PSE10_BH11PSE10_18850 [soil metagenome]